MSGFGRFFGNILAVCSKTGNRPFDGAQGRLFGGDHFTLDTRLRGYDRGVSVSLRLLIL
jgi:hypothetical protein